MKLYKPYTRRQYADLASFCNRNGMIIEDKGDYLESVLPPVHIPTDEEQRQARANAYLQEKDPITCQIMSLRDEEQTPEVVEKINNLIQKRADVVLDIQNRYPYMENEEQTSPAKDADVQDSEYGEV